MPLPAAPNPGPSCGTIPKGLRLWKRGRACPEPRKAGGAWRSPRAPCEPFWGRVPLRAPGLATGGLGSAGRWVQVPCGGAGGRSWGTTGLRAGGLGLASYCPCHGPTLEGCLFPPARSGTLVSRSEDLNVKMRVRNLAMKRGTAREGPLPGAPEPCHRVPDSLHLVLCLKSLPRDLAHQPSLRSGPRHLLQEAGLTQLSLPPGRGTSGRAHGAPGARQAWARDKGTFLLSELVGRGSQKLRGGLAGGPGGRAPGYFLLEEQRAPGLGGSTSAAAGTISPAFAEPPVCPGPAATPPRDPDHPRPAAGSPCPWHSHRPITAFPSGYQAVLGPCPPRLLVTQPPRAPRRGPFSG